MTVANGNGPVNALDAALRKALLPSYPQLGDMHLTDFKVRIMPPPEGPTGTDAVTRVMLESADGAGRRWSTVGVSANIVDASFHALSDAVASHLPRAGAGGCWPATTPPKP